MAGLWLMNHPNDPSKMVQTVFQPTRKKSAGVGSFWWKHLGGLLYDFLVICGCAIFIAVFCRVGSVWVGSFLFQWKHGLSPLHLQKTELVCKNASSLSYHRSCFYSHENIKIYIIRFLNISPFIICNCCFD